MVSTPLPTIERYFVYLIEALVAVATLELIIVRLSASVGGTPGGGLATGLYEAIAALGPIVSGVSFLLALVSVGLVGCLDIKSSSKLNAISSAAMLSLISFSILFFIPPDPTLLMVYTLVAITVVMIIALKFAMNGATSTVRTIAVLLVGVYLSTFYFKAAPAFSYTFEAFKLAYMEEALNIGEGLAVVNTFPIYLLFRKVGGASSNLMKLMVPSIPAVLFSASYLLSPMITTFYITWVFGFTLYLPFPIYAVAIWLYADTLSRLMKVRRGVAYGLLLILLAGRNLQLTYYTLLAILGLLLFTRNALYEGSSLIIRNQFKSLLRLKEGYAEAHDLYGQAEVCTA